MELAAGVRTPASYTAGQCLKDWLETLNTQAEITVTGYRIMARHLTGLKCRRATQWPSTRRAG